MMTDAEMKRLRDMRQQYWELARDAVSLGNYSAMDHYTWILEKLDKQLFSSYQVPHSVISTPVEAFGSGGEYATEPSNFTVHYNGPSSIEYVPTLGCQNLECDDPAHYIPSAALKTSVDEVGPYALTETEKKQKKELDSYNEICGRSVGIGMYHGSYKSWRKEFEETGADFAKERMLAAYKRGDEEAWETGLRDAKFKPVPVVSDIWNGLKAGLRECWSWPVIGIALIAVMFLLALL